jgi:hypothetical protein
MCAEMSRHWTLIALGIAGVVAGCSSAAEVEWMKVGGQPYTAAEFRRDYTECDKTSNRDECLRSRGWVSVTAPNAPKPTGPDMRTAPGMSGTGLGRPRY